jgi:signal transduction histidine kinase
MQALHLSEMKNDSLGIANSHYNIGTIFYYQTRYKRALNHYQKSYAICEVLKNERFIYSSLAAMGSVYEKLENHSKSLEFNTESLELAKKLNYKTGIAYALGNIAMNYAIQKDFVKAEQYLKASISLKLEVGDKWGTIGSNIDLSKLYLEKKKPRKALPVLEQALKMAKELNSKTRQLDIYKNLSSVYDQLKDPITAYSFTKKYIALKDSVLSEKTVEEMGQSKRRYEVQKKEHEIAMLKKENELLFKNEKIQKLQVYIFAILGLFFLSFLWWYKNKLKYQRSMNDLLEEKNDILNVKNEEINVKNKQLEYSNENLEQFAYVASHDLKEPLRMISSFSSLLEKKYKQHIDDTGKEFIHYITDAVSRMEVLLDDLLEFSRAGTQNSPTQLVAVEDIMLVIESNLRHRFENLNGTLIIHKENLPAIKAHRTQLIQLLQNLVSNGVKFKGARDPVVVVDCKKNKGKYVFSVNDNGIGISKENQEKVFEMFRRLNTKDQYEGTGIGLATCKKIVSSWGGDIWIESAEGEGSTFFFTIPYPVDEPLLVGDPQLVEGS